MIAGWTEIAVFLADMAGWPFPEPITSVEGGQIPPPRRFPALKDLRPNMVAAMPRRRAKIRFSM